MTFEEIRKFLLEDWPVWLSLIFLFLSGLMFGIQRKGLILSEFGGSLVIILLMISLYYSIPFFLLGFFTWMSTYKFPKRKFKSEDLLFITSISVISYQIINFLYSRSLSKVDIIFISNRLDNFWVLYFGLLFIYFLVGIKNWIRLFRK